MTREIVWELIRGNPYYKDKPKKKAELYTLSTNEKPKKPDKITKEDIKIFEQLQYGIKNESIK